MLPAVLAIDGGNSKTDVALVAADGTVLTRQRGGGTNPQGLGDEEAMGRLEVLVRAAAAQAGLTGGGPVAGRTSACLAGADLPAEEEQLASLVRARRWSAASSVVNDTFAVLRAGVTGSCGPDGRLQPVAHPGVAVTCGAGINCVGVGPDGQVVRFLSYGEISGDWGGGGDLGRGALWWAARAEDGRGPRTSLRAAVAGHFGLPSVRDVVIGLHQGRIGRDELRGLVPALFTAAGEGDQVAGGLVRRQADEVVTMAATAIRRLGLAGEPVPVALGGSVLSARDPLLTTLISDGLAAAAPGAAAQVIDLPPVAGAALLGLDHARAPAAAETRLRAAFSPPGQDPRTGPAAAPVSPEGEQAMDSAAVTRMRTEIAEQPAAVAATIGALLPRRAEAAALAAGTRQVLFIARGTSDNAAVYGSYLCQAYAGRLATLASPSIATTYRSRIDLSGVLAVALSQSGRTGEIAQTLAWARDCGARTLAITNGPGSPLADTAEVTFATQAGPEQAVPATKSFTTQLAALAVLALALGAPLDPGELRQVPAEIEAMLGRPPELDRAVAELAGVAGVVVSGRGLAYSAALEIALKLKEACYLHAMGLSWADLLHGPIAVVDADTPAIIVAAGSGPVLDGTVELARRVRGAGARAYAIGGGSRLAGVSDIALPGPRLPEWLAPIGLVVPGQLLTEALARRLGIDPDRPRGLSKVTQTD